MIYLSMSIDDNRDHMDEILCDLYDQGFMQEYIDYWQPGTNYHSEQLNNISSIVVLPPDHKFTITPDKVTRGVRSELAYAIEHEIPVFLLYRLKTDSQEWRIYQTTYTYDNGHVYEGKAGTHIVAQNQLHSLARAKDQLNRQLMSQKFTEKIDAVPEGMLYGGIGNTYDEDFHALDKRWFYLS